MINNNECMTVKEFAAASGKSIQSIYKRLNQVDNLLNQYSTKVEKTIYIKKSALEEVYGIKKNSTNSTKVEQPLNQSLKLMNEVIEVLKGQLAEKDKQLLAKDKQIAELLKLQDQQQQLTLNQQQLLITGTEEETSSKAKKKWWQR